VTRALVLRLIPAGATNAGAFELVRDAGKGLHSFPFPLNLSLLCPFPLNLSFLCPPYDAQQSMDVSRRCSS
jgi:hypothetical protein